MIDEKDVNSTCKYLRKELMEGFENLKKLKDSGSLTGADLDYELARDRKSAIILKTLAIELGTERLRSNKITKN